MIEDRPNLSAREARRLIRETRKPIFAWVTLHADDGAYVEVKKGSVMANIPAGSEAKYFVVDREDGVYLN